MNRTARNDGRWRNALGASMTAAALVLSLPGLHARADEPNAADHKLQTDEFQRFLQHVANQPAPSPTSDDPAATCAVGPTSEVDVTRALEQALRDIATEAAAGTPDGSPPPGGEAIVLNGSGYRYGTPEGIPQDLRYLGRE